MRFYEFGDQDKPAILLLPGTCCHWKNNFGHVIDLLKKDFYVVCVSYDGFDENESTIFPTMRLETKKIEQYIKKRFHGTVKAVYGCSLGGSFVGLLAQRNKIHMEHGIIGSSDLDQEDKKWKAKLKTDLFIPMYYRMLQKGKVNKKLYNKMKNSTGEEYTKKGLLMMGFGGVDVKFIKKESMKNQFYSDLITALKEKIEAEGTTIHCFYAEKMGEEYQKRYQVHFKNPHIVRHDLNHEELLVCHKEEWVEEIKSCVLK